MSNPTSAANKPACIPPAASRDELVARIAALEAERDVLRQQIATRARPASGAPDGGPEWARAIADAAPAMLWITDSANRRTFVSRGWYEFTGQAADEALGFGWLGAVHPADRASAEQAFLDAVREQRPFSLDHRLRRTDGQYRWALDEGRPRFSEDGVWLGYAGAVVDVHDRHLAVAGLSRSEARYQALFESIDDGFCIIEVLFDGHGDPVDYRFLETNPAFVKQTGLVDAVGRTARELLPDLEPHWFRIYGRVAQTGEPVRFENGSKAMRRWFDVFAFRVEEAERRRVALLFADITEQRRADQERERLLRETEAARAEAETANHAKAEFLASMSHELRTPLNAMSGYVNLLELEVHGPITEAQRGALGRVAANQRHLLVLINEILAYAKLEAGRTEFNLQRLTARELLSSVEPLVAPLAAAKGIAYSVEECDPALDLVGDEERVRQILLNLVTNAIKFTPGGGWVLLACTAEPGWVDIQVRDNGPGISPEKQQAIFDPFVQVDRRLDSPQEGVGLGLAISRDLARAMDGELTVQSAPGEGSSFTLRMPRGGDAEDPRPEHV